MKHLLAITVLTVAGVAVGAHAFVVDCRWTYETTNGNNFLPLPLGGLNVDPTTQPFVRLRLSFQVTDGSPSDAAGGFIGWNFGTLLASGDCCESLARTPGRRAPFNFIPTGNGVPVADPVPCDTTITGIDATLGFQNLAWGCAPDGAPLPMPVPVVRGLGSFVSVYDVTLNLRPGLGSASVTAGGNSVVSSQWFTVGAAVPPDCGDPADPLDDIPGSVIYAPTTAAPVPFVCVAQVNCIPAAPSACLFALGMLTIRRRQR